jgi:hypothetical protein
MNEFMLINNTNSTLDDEAKSIQDTVFYTNICIMAIAILGNIISIYVFLKKSILKKRFNWYLLVSTMLEIIFCTIIMADYLFAIFQSQFLHDNNEISRVLIDFSVHTSDSCIGILTVFLSLDRLYAIKYPLDIKEYFTNLHAKLTISLSVLILIVLNILSYSFCEMNIFTDVHIIYCAIVSPLIFNTIPLIVILFINVILVYKIAIYYKKKQSNASINRNNKNLVDVQLTGSKTLVKLRRSEQDQKKLTKFQKSHYSVILFTALWSVLISIPYYTLKSIYLSSSLEFFEGHFHYPTLRITQTISSIFFNFNHCIHFFIYFVFHREFREELLKVIKKLSCKNILSKTNST